MTSEDAVARLVPEPSLSFRGGLGNLSRSAFAPPARFRHHGELVTTRDVRLATNNFAEEDVLGVLGRTGRDTAPLSPDASTLEIVYLPEVTLEVVAQQRLADHLWLTVVRVEDDEPAQPLDADEAVRRIGTAVVRARTLPAADLTDPTRYLGPIGTDAAGRLDQLT
jgi:hypothetical protein